jgi:hypothetical protein
VFARGREGEDFPGGGNLIRWCRIDLINIRGEERKKGREKGSDTTNEEKHKK